MAVLAPFYERGIPQLTSPVLMLLFISIAVLFMRRVQWTWKLMQWVAFTEIAINALFFPEPKFHGAYTSIIQVLITAVMLASCIISWSLIRRPDVKAWFVRI